MKYKLLDSDIEYFYKTKFSRGPKGEINCGRCSNCAIRNHIGDGYRQESYIQFQDAVREHFKIGGERLSCTNLVKAVVNKIEENTQKNISLIESL